MPFIPTRTPKEKTDHDPFYQAPRWKGTRKAYFAVPENNLCAVHKRKGQSEIAFILDHILPRAWYPELEWQATNFQGLCRTCDQRKRVLEKQIRSREHAYIVLKEYLK